MPADSHPSNIRRYVICLLVAACGARTPLQWNHSDDALQGAGGSSQRTVPTPEAGSPGAAGRRGLPGGTGGTGVAGASDGAGMGGAPLGEAGYPGVSGHPDGGSPDLGEAGNTSAGAGGETDMPFLAASISLGSENARATVDHGPHKCWGDTFNGLLGNDYRIGPTIVPGLEAGVRVVSVGTHAACALMESGDVECFGMGFG